MAVPAAPTTGEPIIEAWGDIVHAGIVDMDIQMGTSPITVTNAASGSVTITFPRPFATPPVVMVCTNATNYFGYYGAVTATTGVMGVAEKSGTVRTATFAVSWIAYGKRK